MAEKRALTEPRPVRDSIAQHPIGEGLEESERKSKIIELNSMGLIC